MWKALARYGTLFHADALLPVWLSAIKKMLGETTPLSIAGAPVPQWSVPGHLAVSWRKTA
jgi:hypothetical protein